MDVAVQARKSGKKIGIADRTEQLTTEIIGLSSAGLRFIRFQAGHD